MIKKLFAAVLVPDELKLSLESDLAKAIKLWPKPFGLKLIPKEDYHFTIFYLGRQEEGNIPEIISAMESVCRNIAPFTIEISDIDYAENDPLREMVWARGSSEKLDTLRTRLWSELEKRRLIFEETRKNNNAHINLVRFESMGISEFPKLYMPINKKFTVNSIYLMESLPIKNGPKYSVVAAIDLKSFQE